MMPEPCAYARCTSRITHPEQAATLSLPGGDEQRFCSVTCAWSWFQEHVEGKAAELQVGPPMGMAALDKPIRWEKVPEKSPTPPPKPRKSSPPKSSAAKPSQFPTTPVTQPIKTYAPGEFQFDWVPDEDVKRQLSQILQESIDGPYRFAWPALVPFIRIGPSDPQTPVTVRATARLHLMGAQARTLHGLHETMDFVVEFQGIDGPVHVRDVLTVPGKQLLAKTALDAYERKSLGS